MLKLRPYQEKAVSTLRALFASKKMRVVLYSPTGSGKTEIGMELIRLALAKKKRVVFICNRIELVRQTSSRIAASGIQHGIIQGSNTCMSWEPVQVCSIQTIDKRGYPDCDLIVVDEAHGTAGSKAYQRFMEHYAAVPMIGLTATPFARGMGKTYPWGPMWEALTAATTIRDLVNDGYLVDCDIYAPSEPDLKNVKITAGDYNEKQLGVAVDKQELVGDIVTHWLKLSGGKSTVCFATNIAHSKHIVDRFTAAGIPAEHIDCYTDDDERRRILKRVLAGDTKIISNVGILQEGWDFPACEVMILARPTRSLIKYIQMAGRVLRPFEGKEKALILDHSGTCRRLGFPTDDLPLHLDDGKPRDKKKEAEAEKEKKEKLPILCKQCSAVLAQTHTACPRCGFELPKKCDVKERAGSLSRLDKTKIGSMTKEDRKKTYSELLGYARERGYKDGWAWWKCKEIFGSVPRDRVAAVTPSKQTLNLVRHLNIKHANSKEKEMPM